MKKGIHIINLKKQKSICHRTSFYFNIQLKTPKSSEFAIFLTNSGQKSLTMFSSSCCNNYFIEFLKIGKLKN